MTPYGLSTITPVRAGAFLAEGLDSYPEKPIRYQAFLASVAALLEARKE